MRNNFTADWAFGITGAIKNVVKGSFPAELRLWPLLKAFDFDAFRIDQSHFAIILRDKLSGIPAGPGEFKPFPFSDYPTLPLRSDRTEEWLSYLVNKFSLGNEDAAFVLPIHDCGRNDAAGDFALFSEDEKALWNAEVQFNIVRQRLSLPGALRSRPDAQSHITFNVSGTNARVNIDSSDSSVNIVRQEIPEVFGQLLSAIQGGDLPQETRTKFEAAVAEMKEAHGSDRFGKKYKDFMSILADHIQVFGPLVAPYLPALAELVK